VLLSIEKISIRIIASKILRRNNFIQLFPVWYFVKILRKNSLRNLHILNY